MISALELQKVGPGLFSWQAYDPKIKAELFSTAIFTPSGYFLVDPIPLAHPALNELRDTGEVGGVIITNQNHLRASSEFAERFSVPIFAHPASFPDQKPSRFVQVADGDKICDTLEVIAIDGAAPGEIVLHYVPEGGALIIGDALINFGPDGFTFLPAKYCSNQKAMRRSLQKLINRSSERLLFAHGLPILSQASARLQALLMVDR
jgi:glyoxylase-like metal-dependent hydrolase (beta-lactamase superfamily II)